MSHQKNDLDRREFLKTTGQVAVGAGILAQGLSTHANVAPAVPARAVSLTSALPTRVFGRTGYTLPILGHGGSAMIDRDKHYYGIELPSFDERVKMVRAAYDKGVRYFDTARIYNESEKIMGEALCDVRKDIYISSKVLVIKPEHVRRSVEDSLAALRMDSIDCMQIHGPAIETMGYDGAMLLHEKLIQLRDEGLFTFIGLTGHSIFQDLLKLIETGGFDQVLIEYGYSRSGLRTRHSEETLDYREQCLAKASERGMGVVAMKVLGALIYGHNSKNMVSGYDAAALAKLPGAAMRWALQDRRIHILNIGVSLPTDIEENIRLLTADLTFTADDKTLLEAFTDLANQNPHIQRMPIV